MEEIGRRIGGFITRDFSWESGVREAADVRESGVIICVLKSEPKGYV